ncbi:hypothetical protein [Alterisphingorhabdus coralli]|uniref:DUF3325 domain-containing protein n=1 Tax=Alterisphingorhabdus coralli TaxID=3071408 RepID=A0AA97F738_9SPHN|nr:hypothetical protein [Parasphingorhabdus sp. SCSIO 66989]WOE74307.1 hypothetical protein RB602_10640 [Parasphingorhabdus sp. SCSIO 66989]
MVLLALFHSLAGHRVLLGPVLAEQHGMLRDDTNRAIMLFAWHSTSFIILLVAAYLFLVAADAVMVYPPLITLIGMTFFGLAIFHALATKRRHPGWIILSAIAFTAIGALLF